VILLESKLILKIKNSERVGEKETENKQIYSVPGVCLVLARLVRR
jgi:hypothetical protein